MCRVILVGWFDLRTCRVEQSSFLVVEASAPLQIAIFILNSLSSVSLKEGEDVDNSEKL